MARRRRSPLQKALHAMAPHRVLWRAMSGPEIKRALRPTTRTSSASRKKRVATGKIVPTKKTAKKTAAKRANPYAAALAIPGQNRVIAARQAKAAQPAKKTTAVRKTDGSGRFDGRKAMDPRERAMFEAAEQRYVDPALQVRNSRTRRG